MVATAWLSLLLCPFLILHPVAHHLVDDHVYPFGTGCGPQIVDTRTPEGHPIALDDVYGTYVVKADAVRAITERDHFLRTIRECAAKRSGC